MDCLVLNLIWKASENFNNSNRRHQAKKYKLSFVRRSLLKVYLYKNSYVISIEGVNLKFANDKLTVL